MNSDRLKALFKTPPPPASTIGRAISCLFFFSSLQINYFVRGEPEREKEERRSRGASYIYIYICASGVARARPFFFYLVVASFLISSGLFPPSFFYYYYFFGLQSSSSSSSFILLFFKCFFFLLLLSLFFSTWKDFVNYCFLPLRNEAATRKKKERKK